MRFLVHHGYRSVSLEDLACSPGQCARGKTVAITFDDGYMDFFQNALPVLQKYRLKSTVFLVSGQLGSYNRWDQGKIERVPLMGLDELRQARHAGVSFGAHGCTHRPLTTLTPQEAWDEISSSKCQLEQALSATVGVFSYPYGRSTPVLEGMVADAGYVAACGIEQREHRLFNLSRIDAPRCKGTGLTWRLKLRGAHFYTRRMPVVRFIKRGIVRSLQ